MSEPTITPEELARAILPKSDQLNADDLIVGPITVRILAVRGADSPEQPIAIAIEGHKPYKPCKSMLRVLTLIWGERAAEWLGRSVTLYRDPEVKWGGVKVGGIRISHMSGLDKPVSVAITETRGKRLPFRVEPLVVREAPSLAEVLAPATIADLDRYRASESKPATTAEDQPKIAAFLFANPKALDKVRAWVAANPPPDTTDTP